MGERSITPESAAARDIMADGSKGPAAERFLRGVMGMLNGYEGAARLNGIALATTQYGDATNRFLSVVEGHVNPLAPPDLADPAVQSAIAGSLRDATGAARERTTPLAHYDATSGWLTLSYAGSRPAIATISHPGVAPDGDLKDLSYSTAAAIRHEVEMAKSPPGDPSAPQTPDWLRDAVANVLTYSNGTVDATARTLGFNPEGTRLNIDGVPHLEESVALNRLLTFAGIDTNTAAGRLQAEALLQSAPGGQVADALTMRIASTVGIGSAALPILRSRILAIGGNAAGIDSLTNDLNRYQTFGIL